MSNTKYMVMTASTRPSANCWGTYRRVAVVLVDVEFLREQGRETPAMISEQAAGIVRIIRTWENLNVGKTKRCAYERALAEAHALCMGLNQSELLEEE
jgi:hypothetical protein